MFLREHIQASRLPLNSSVKSLDKPPISLGFEVKETTGRHVSPLTMKTGDTIVDFVPINVVMQDFIFQSLHFLDLLTLNKTGRCDNGRLLKSLPWYVNIRQMSRA